MFWCLPYSEKCEWANLRSFVQHFNVLNQANYRWARCLDVSDRNSSQPEVLLEGNGDTTMVIERKVVVRPLDYFKGHSTEHRFFDTVIEGLRNFFRDDLYVLELRSRDLGGRVSEVEANGRRIVEAIRSNADLIRTHGGIAGQTPIRWSFHQVPADSRDENAPDFGVGVRIYDNSVDFATGPDDWNEKRERAKIEVTDEVKKCMDSVAKKFANWPDSLKVVLFEIYGDDTLFLDEGVESIIQNVDIPSSVDEIWIALPEWVSAYDWEVGYSRLWSKEA